MNRLVRRLAVDDASRVGAFGIYAGSSTAALMELADGCATCATDPSAFDSAV